MCIIIYAGWWTIVTAPCFRYSLSPIYSKFWCMANPFLCVQIVPFQMYTNITLFICVEFNFMLARSVIYCRATTWLLKKKKKIQCILPLCVTITNTSDIPMLKPTHSRPSQLLWVTGPWIQIKAPKWTHPEFLFFFFCFIYILSHSENRVMRFHENRLKSNSSALLDTVSTWSIVGWVIPEERHNCFFTILILQVKKFQKIYIGKKLQWH